MIKKLSLCLLSVTLIISSSVSQSVGAVTAANWRAGRIIDDSVFINKNEMSIDQIQSFLNSKVGTSGYSGSTPGQCDTNGIAISELGGGTRAQYGAANGNPAPFTCLKDYYEVPKTSPSPGIPANNYGGAAIPSGAKSAAQLIWDAAQTYSINPKVLLIKLQTESAGPLTIDDWPFLRQYTYAMGAHCPDSGPGGTANCDENYAGFSMQILESAALLRYYLDNMSQPWWPYKKPLQNNYILWNVSGSRDANGYLCEGSNVYVENKATAALYTYTPYQPNQAALDNMYGTGNLCSAYGNRNFWRTYNDWFGNTIGPDYSATINSVVVYSDSGYTTPISKMGSRYVLQPNQIVYAKAFVTNNGRATWDGLTNLGTSGPIDRISAFYSPSWINLRRAANASNTPVTPYEDSTFSFQLTAPASPGIFSEGFSIVEDGTAWTSSGFYIDIQVATPVAYPVGYTDNVLPTNSALLAGQTLTSPDGYSVLSLSFDGVLQLRRDYQVVWSLSTSAGPGSRLTMQSDGNLVFYRQNGSVVWHTVTSDQGVSRLYLQEDGNLVIYKDSGGASWASGTNLSASHLSYPAVAIGNNGILFTGQAVRSVDRNYSLYLQPDGNLVLYSPTRALWASDTVGLNASRLIMQSDGNLVIYNNSGQPVWNSRTAGRGSSSLYVQPDGNLVIYNGAGSTWSTGTYGQQ
jgi:hypothetical protein